MKRVIVAGLTVLALALSARAGYREVTLLDGVAPGADGKIDVVAIYPHQDDESFWSGGTLHRLKQDPRVRLHLVCLTRGDMSGAKDALAISGSRLGDIRVKELALAAQVYQADELIQFDYHDQGLAAVGDEVLIGRLAAVLAATGAEVVLTYGRRSHRPPRSSGLLASGRRRLETERRPAALLLRRAALGHQADAPPPARAHHAHPQGGHPGGEKAQDAGALFPRLAGAFRRRHGRGDGGGEAFQLRVVRAGGRAPSGRGGDRLGRRPSYAN